MVEIHCAGFGAALVATVVMHPADVLRTRFQLLPLDSLYSVRGSIESILKVAHPPIPIEHFRNSVNP